MRFQKRKLKRAIFILAYYLGINAMFYWLNRKAKRVVVFHNVMPDELCDGLPEGLTGLKFSMFKAIVDQCARHFKFSTEWMNPNTLTITFDDGYLNQYSVAYRHLKACGISAVLFFSPGTRNVLAIDKMVAWRCRVPRSAVPGGDIGRFWAESFWLRYLADGHSRGEDTLAWLDGIYSMKKVMSELPQDFVRLRFGSVSDKQLQEMRDAGWVIGWHTKTHTPLSALSDEEIRDEMDAPPEFRNVCMAFPYGTEKCVSELAMRIAEEKGFPCAFSYANSSVRNTSAFFLPRLPYVSADKYELEAILSGFAHFVSYRKLLPIIVGR